MTLILNNDDVSGVLDVGECVSVLESAYRDLDRGAAVNRPRSDIYTPHERGDGAHYVFKSFEGMLPSAGVVALRLNSDIIEWSEYAGSVRKDKIPLAPGGRWVGLILLFSTRTGELLAIMPDGVIQSARVSVTNAVAARQMARQDAEIYGLVGTGQQAGAQLLAISQVRSLKQVRVFSPNVANRSRFAREYAERTGLDVRAVDTAREAARGADILGVATSAVRPVVYGDCVEPGMHITCVKGGELGDEILRRSARTVVHTRDGSPHNYFAGVAGQRESVGHDPTVTPRPAAEGQQDPADSASREDGVGAIINSAPDLAALVAGRTVGRESDDEINVFVNNIGVGIQFAAFGATVYAKAREAGLGREVPDDWFSETVHP